MNQRARKPSPPPADDTLALESFLPYRLARAAEAVSRQFAALYRERHGLTRPEWRTLATIGQFTRVTGRRQYQDLVDLARGYEARLIETLGKTRAARLEAGLSAIETKLAGC